MKQEGVRRFLFDTSAESWIARGQPEAGVPWIGQQIYISSVTILERMRGYQLLWQRTTDRAARKQVEAARLSYLNIPKQVLPMDTVVAVIAAGMLALIPDPPTPPKRSHRLTESRQERLCRWRFDVMIAGTALAHGMALVHNNPGDFAPIRKAIELFPEQFPGLGPLELIRVESSFASIRP